MLVMACARSAASLSASESVAGSHADMLKAEPTRADWTNRFERSEARALRQIDHVRSAQEIEHAFASGSVRAFQIAQIYEGSGLVENHPVETRSPSSCATSCA